MDDLPISGSPEMYECDFKPNISTVQHGKQETKPMIGIQYIIKENRSWNRAYGKNYHRCWKSWGW